MKNHERLEEIKRLYQKAQREVNAVVDDFHRTAQQKMQDKPKKAE